MRRRDTIHWEAGSTVLRGSFCPKRKNGQWDPKFNSVRSENIEIRPTGDKGYYFPSTFEVYVKDGERVLFSGPAVEGYRMAESEHGGGHAGTEFSTLSQAVAAAERYAHHQAFGPILRLFYWGCGRRCDWRLIEQVLCEAVMERRGDET